VLDFESSLLDESWNVASDVAALECPLKERFDSLLPTLYVWIGRDSMFKEDELAVWLQDAPETFNCFRDARNRAHRKSAHDCVNAVVFQGQALSGQVDEFDVEFCTAALLLGHTNHSGVWFKSVELRDFGGIVVNEIDAGTDADFKDITVR